MQGPGCSHRLPPRPKHLPEYFRKYGTLQFPCSGQLFNIRGRYVDTCIGLMRFKLFVTSFVYFMFRIYLNKRLL